MDARPLTPLQAWIEVQIAAGARQSDLAARLGLDEGTMSNIRHGRRGAPRSRLVAWREVTGLTLEQLLASPRRQALPRTGAPNPPAG